MMDELALQFTVKNIGFEKAERNTRDKRLEKWIALCYVVKV